MADCSVQTQEEILFSYANIPSLEFTFDRDHGLVVILQEIPDGPRTAYKPLELHPTWYIPSDMPHFWSLMRSSTFANVEFNPGDIPDPFTPHNAVVIKHMFRQFAAAITTEIGSRIACYRVRYSNARLLPLMFEEALDDYFMRLPIPLQN